MTPGCTPHALPPYGSCAACRPASDDPMDAIYRRNIEAGRQLCEAGHPALIHDAVWQARIEAQQQCERVLHDGIRQSGYRRGALVALACVAGLVAVAAGLARGRGRR